MTIKFYENIEIYRNFKIELIETQNQKNLIEIARSN